MWFDDQYKHKEILGYQRFVYLLHLLNVVLYWFTI